MTDEQMQELDRVLKLWSQSYQTITDGLPHEDRCHHEMRHYLGFMEEYDYCIKCDAKHINGQWIDKKLI